MKTRAVALPAEPAAAQAHSMIELQRVVKTFKNAAGEFIVLKGVDLTIGRGEFVAIVGKSGSGKSTLLNMITGIDHPTGGRVIVNGMDIYSVSESQRSLWRGKNLGIVFQFFQLLPMLTLLENVMLPMDYVQLYDFDQRPHRAMELLEMVGLADQAHKLPLAVSTGQQQMTAIARALATDPPLLVADEPTGNLDSKTAAHMIDVFDELVRRGKTIVMVTHDPSLTSRTSRTIVISDGELIDETVARAMPTLRHRHMLEFSKLARRQAYPAGQVILEPGQPLEEFLMIAGGQAESLEERPARLEAGAVFGGIELLGEGRSPAGLRAGPGGLEVLAIPREVFLRVMEQSPRTVEFLRGKR
jgi:ABC-type lipoprotein export system ATPase subunit